ncbi:MAG: hypothetical protein ACRDNW_20085, partial [Trebonia sp.]
IVADVIDSRNSRVPPTWQPVFAGAAVNGAPADLRPPARQSSPATRAMRLSRTSPQPVIPEEPPTGVWQTGPQAPAGYRDGYTGAFDTNAFDFDPLDTQERTRDTATFDRTDDYLGHGDDQGWAPEAGDRSKRGGGRGTRHGRHDDDDYGRPTKRRWPVVTGALGLLVLLLAGGAYGFWRYNQSQYYVSVSSNGFVSIFRGTNQSLAGISMSSLQSESTLKASLLTSGDQATLKQTISADSLNDAMQRIDQLQAGVNNCQQTYQQLATWQSKDLAYQHYLTAKAAAAKAKAPAVVNSPGAMPTQMPSESQCAPSTAFGILASALPAAGEKAPSATAGKSPGPTSSAAKTPAAG